MYTINVHYRAQTEVTKLNNGHPMTPGIAGDVVRQLLTDEVLSPGDALIIHPVADDPSPEVSPAGRSTPFWP